MEVLPVNAIEGAKSSELLPDAQLSQSSKRAAVSCHAVNTYLRQPENLS